MMIDEIAKKVFSFAMLLFLIALTNTYAQNKSMSPYFMVLTEDKTHAQMPLETTKVDVQISGVIADVNVRQVYKNSGTIPLEAIYVFPASTRAAVYNMVMKVDDREIKAVVKEKRMARNMYEQAKRKGKTASLLEEERPNVFKMNVANIMPGATVEVNMSYTELLVPTGKVYEFVYPTVVGPRYVSEKEKLSGSSVSWSENPYLTQDLDPASTFQLKVNLNAGMPVQEIRCETHENEIEFKDKTLAELIMKEPYGGNRDFVMQYRLAGNAIQSGILLYEDQDGENYFLSMMQPPSRPKAADIPVREYVFIVDVSGSMSGFPLEISKQLMNNLLSRLREKDKFNIVFFAGGSEVFSTNSLPATAENITSALNYMSNQRGSGGTELLNALRTALALNKDMDCARSFVILTDGYVSVEKETFDYMREHLGEANFFSFGIGSSVNRHLIEGMAHVGYGEAFVALNREGASLMADKFIKYVTHPVLTNIRFHFNGIEAYDILPEQIPDLFAERPLIISGKYRGEAKGTLSIEGKSGSRIVKRQLKIVKKSGCSGKAIKYLWAREKIRLLADYDDLLMDEKTRLEIIRLGEQYNLLTEYTSFVAIDSVVSNDFGFHKSVKQALPLPKGISAPPMVTDVLCIVEDDAELDEELEVYNTEMVDFELEEEADEQVVFYMIEDMPEFPGGDKAIQKYIQTSIQYPKQAKENGIHGCVYISFVIDVDGSITDVKVVRGVSPLIDKEAIRVIKSMPKWQPGKQRGKAVKVSQVLPICFRLGS